MKKIKFFFVLSFFSMVANAQLKVSSNGRVTIGDHINASYPLSIRGRGSSYSLYMNTYTGGGAYFKLNSGGYNQRSGLEISTNLANDTTTYGVL